VLSRWRIPIGATALLAVAVYAAAHGVVQNSTTTGAQAPCPRSSREPRQSIELIAVDGSESTANTRLRAEYAQTVFEIAQEATAQGAYLIVDRFASSIAGIETICETSTRVSAAAPLFTAAKRTALDRMLDGASRKVSNVRASEHGTDVYAELGDSITKALRAGDPVAARIVILTDGDQAADGIHLRRLLGKYSDSATAHQIVGGQAPPDARGVAIEIRGVGGTGVGGTIPTRTVLRMEHVWRSICASTHAKRCFVTPDLTS
jgi:hypothetical protein